LSNLQLVIVIGVKIGQHIEALVVSVFVHITPIEEAKVTVLRHHHISLAE
jgi:hypothetical protein